VRLFCQDLVAQRDGTVAQRVSSVAQRVSHLAQREDDFLKWL